MFDTYEIHREDFEKAIMCLDTVIATVFSQITLSKSNDLYRKYKDTIISSNYASEELQKLSTESTKHILCGISQDYRKYLLKWFFSQDGLTLYVYARIRDLTESHINKLLENNN